MIRKGRIVCLSELLLDDGSRLAFVLPGQVFYAVGNLVDLETELRVERIELALTS